jgi:antitoxin MazE
LTQAVIGRWGRNLAVRLPREVAETAGIRTGDRVEIESQGDGIIIRRCAPHFTLTELFHGRSPAEWRALYDGAFDWGPDVGREIVEE